MIFIPAILLLAQVSATTLRVGSVSGQAGFESETTAYAAAIASNSGTIQPLPLLCVDRFVKSAKAHGYWSYITDCSPMAGDQTNAAVIKLVSHSSASQAKLQLYGGLTANDYNPLLGWNLSGGRFIWPGLWMSNTIFAPSSNGAAVWVSGFTTNSRGWFFGSENYGAYQAVYLWGGSYNGNWQLGAAAGGDATNAPVVSSTVNAIDSGLVFLTRDGGSTVSLYFDDYLASTASGAAGAIHPDATMPWLLGARSNSSSPPFTADSLPGQYWCGFYCVHTGIPTSLEGLFYADVKELMKRLGRLNMRGTRRPTFLVTGQSNAEGAGATGTGTPSSVCGNLIGNASEWHFANTAQTNLFQQRAISAPYVKYCGWAAFQEQLSSLCRAAGYGSTNDSLIESFAINGATLASISQGTDAYQQSTNWAVQQNTLEVDKYSQPLQFPAILSVHGESDSGSSGYGSAIYNFQQSYKTNLNAINRDSAAVPVLTCQIPTYTQGATEYVNDQLLSQHETNSANVVLVMPRYQLPYVSDHIHLDESGYTRMGEQYAVAWFKLLSVGSYDPLRPSAVALSSGTNITVTFTGFENGLALDTNSVSWLTQPNYGFSYSDSGGGASISSVSVQGSSRVVVTLGTDVSARSGRVLSYAHNSTTNNNAAGLSLADGGNLRDQSTRVGFTSGSNLWNWCVHFQKSF